MFHTPSTDFCPDNIRTVTINPFSFYARTFPTRFGRTKNRSAQYNRLHTFRYSRLRRWKRCPPEVAIYIHGVWASESGAIEQADRTRLSLFTDHYRIPVVGFTWDSNTAFSPDDLSTSEHGWKVAKKNS